VVVLTIWALFGNSYFNQQTTSIPRDTSHVFQGSSPDLSLSAAQSNYKHLYEELLASKAGESEAVQQLSMELAAERMRNNNLMAQMKQQHTFPALPQLPQTFDHNSVPLDSSAWGWLDHIKDSVNYLTTAVTSVDYENDEANAQYGEESNQEPQTSVEANNNVQTLPISVVPPKIQKSSPLISKPATAVSAVTPSASTTSIPIKPIIPEPVNKVVSPVPLTTKVASPVSVNVATAATPVPVTTPANVATALSEVSTALTTTTPQSKPASEEEEEDGEWPVLGSLQYVTQEVVDKVRQREGDLGLPPPLILFFVVSKYNLFLSLSLHFCFSFLSLFEINSLPMRLWDSPAQILVVPIKKLVGVR
jgi:hypothetical protein